MKRFLCSLPFLFIFGLLIWVINSIVASIFIPGHFTFDIGLFNLSLENIYTRLMIISFSILLYMVLFRIFLYEKDQKMLRNAFNHSFPMCLIDFKGHIIQANSAYWETLGRERQGTGKRCSLGGSDKPCPVDSCPLPRIKSGDQEVVTEGTREIDGKRHHFLIRAKPLTNSLGEVVGIIESYNDITERKTLEQEKQRLIDELQNSLEQVKQLKGLLPICPSCKHVRDDMGYWEQIESYLQAHSEAEITPSLCPECKEQSLEPLMDTPDCSHENNTAHSRDTQWLKVMLQ